MALNAPDVRHFALDLTLLDADISHAGGQIDQLIAVGGRLSCLGTEIVAAYERAYRAAAEASAA